MLSFSLIYMGGLIPRFRSPSILDLYGGPHSMLPPPLKPWTTAAWHRSASHSACRTPLGPRGGPWPCATVGSPRSSRCSRGRGARAPNRPRQGPCTDRTWVEGQAQEAAPFLRGRVRAEAVTFATERSSRARSCSRPSRPPRRPRPPSPQKSRTEPADRSADRRRPSPGAPTIEDREDSSLRARRTRVQPPRRL